MVVVLREGATEEELEQVIRRLQHLGLGVHVSRGVRQTVIGVIGERKEEAQMALEAMPQVQKVIPILAPYKLAARQFRAERTVVSVGDARIGGDEFTVIAGPCSVESYEQTRETADAVRAAGVRILRGGAFKPRTGPYSFQGLAEEGLRILAAVKEETGLKVATEVMDTRMVEKVAEVADILQIGARNMQNYALLKEVGRTRHPVILKRGLAATIEEWLLAAEYILSAGNPNVILCERGIRTFETYTRNTMDLNAVVAVHELSHLPVIADPSHGTGRWQMVIPLARASLAAGADGLIVEVHPRPEEALSDGAQSLNLERFRTMMEELSRLAGAMGRELPGWQAGVPVAAGSAGR